MFFNIIYMEVSELLGMLGTGGVLEGDSPSTITRDRPEKPAFPPCGSGDQTQLVRLDSKCLYLLLGHLTNSQIDFLNIYFLLFLYWHAYLVLTPPHLACIHLHPQLFHCQTHVFSDSYCFCFGLSRCQKSLS